MLTHNTNKGKTKANTQNTNKGKTPTKAKEPALNAHPQHQQRQNHNTNKGKGLVNIILKFI